MLARCAPLRRLRSLLALLEAGMRDVVAGWLDGSLARAGWVQAKVEHLLVALFEDSEYRQDAMARVRASAGRQYSLTTSRHGPCRQYIPAILLAVHSYTGSTALVLVNTRSSALGLL